MGRIIKEKVVCCDTGENGLGFQLRRGRNSLNVPAWVDDHEIDHSIVITQMEITFVRGGNWLGFLNQGVRIH